MADEASEAPPAMVESAVVLPEAEETAAPATQATSLKRRQSSETSESTKRPRMDSFTSKRSHSPTNGHEASQSQAMRPQQQRRGSGAPARDEERKRGQRLFGGLLNTLSQGGASNRVQQKRAEVEKRQRERLKERDQEGEQELQKKRERLIEIRWKQQERWDEESMRIRHDATLARAHFLKTTTQPVLYYKPWKLLPAQQRRIDDQIEESERLINDEVADFEYQRKQDRGRRDDSDAGQLQQISDANGTAGEATLHPSDLEPSSKAEVVDDQDEMEETNEDYVMY